MSTAATPPERGTAIVLAAGAGTRMKSKLSKVLQPLLGQPMAAFPVGSAQAAGLDVLVVVNHQEDQVRAGLAGDGVRFVRQEALNGTGGAVIDALAGLPATGVAVVLYGDCPLIRAETLTRLLDAHAAGPLATVVTAHAPDPAGYGRLVRDAAGRPQAVVEHKECTPAQLAITEVNVGLYAFDIEWMRETLPTLEPHSHKNEVYLTDLVAAAAQAEALEVVVHDDIDEMMGVNDKWSLCEARRLLQDRVMEAHARAGVTFESPTSTVVEFGVQIGADARVEAGAVLRGRTRVGEGATIGAHSVLIDAEVARDVHIREHSLLEHARVAEGCVVGPYARLRPGADVQRGARVGNFVEIKKSVVEPGAKVNHLSYIGDARVGAGANVGAGTITCNYDGFFKRHTDIGAGAFIGSNSALVAPVSIGDGAMVAAGSTITGDVPADALALARGRQANKAGRSAEFRARRAAEKAEKAEAAKVPPKTEGGA